jgi:hypothetical protein
VLYTRQEQEIYLFTPASKRAVGPTLPITECGAGPLRWGVGVGKAARSESDHTLLSSAEVKNAWSYTSAHMEHFSFTLLFRSLLAKRTILHAVPLRTPCHYEVSPALWAYNDAQHFCT